MTATFAAFSNRRNDGFRVSTAEGGEVGRQRRAGDCGPPALPLSRRTAGARGDNRDWGGLQRRIDLLEDKAIRRGRFSDVERDFLLDFYATLATGGKLLLVTRQTGKLMDHYLAGSGTDYPLEPEIFTTNTRVQRRAALLQKQALGTPCVDGRRLSSGVFSMPDASNVDSVFGLYFGTLYVTQHRMPEGGCDLRFRAEVPWVWPSYPSLRQKYGDPHAESFPLPNLKSLFFGRRYALFVDNGLGHQLEELGLAKSFLAFAEWPAEQSSGRDAKPTQ